MGDELRMTQKDEGAVAGEKVALPVGPLVAAWLLPGGGHFLQGRWGRGALLLGSISLMFVSGLANGGRFYEPARGNPVDTLGFLGDLCSGLLFLGAKFSGYAALASPAPSADYGTKFLLVAGLLNVLAILDAHDIAVGKKS